MNTLRKESKTEKENKDALLKLFRENPIHDEEILENLTIFLSRQTISRFIFLHELYKKILDVPGIVMDLGCRFGQTMTLFTAFRGMYEPYNYTRRIVGFDTFSGFPSTDKQDGVHAIVKKGAYQTPTKYEKFLEALLSLHEAESPVPHIKKSTLVKGDASRAVPAYLREHRETVVALAYIDFDLYEPTKVCLKAIEPYLVKGSIIAFDELNSPEFPGETAAMREVFQGRKLCLRRLPFVSYPSYAVVE